MAYPRTLLQAFRGSSGECETEAALCNCKQLVDDFWPVNVAPDCQVVVLCLTWATCIVQHQTAARLEQHSVEPKAIRQLDAVRGGHVKNEPWRVVQQLVSNKASGGKQGLGSGFGGRMNSSRKSGVRGPENCRNVAWGCRTVRGWLCGVWGRYPATCHNVCTSRNAGILKGNIVST